MLQGSPQIFIYFFVYIFFFYILFLSVNHHLLFLALGLRGSRNRGYALCGGGNGGDTLPFLTSPFFLHG